MKNYSEPKQNYKGLWITTVTNEKGFTVEIVAKTTKKSLTNWIKEDKSK